MAVKVPWVSGFQDSCIQYLNNFSVSTVFFSFDPVLRQVLMSWWRRQSEDPGLYSDSMYSPRETGMRIPLSYWWPPESQDWLLSPWCGLHAYFLWTFVMVSGHLNGFTYPSCLAGIVIFTYSRGKPDAPSLPSSCGSVMWYRCCQ